MSEPQVDVILEACNMVKRYPGTIALNDVTFRAHRNKVNVLIGENGAGKSTLMRVLAGVESADQGCIYLNGSAIAVRSPLEASTHGIAIVHQELSVLPNLDLSENIFAGRELVKSGVFVDRGSQDVQSYAALERLRKPMPVKTQAARLSLGARQIVELARTLAHGAKVLILDEPTSALSMAEVDSLFRVIDELKQSGVTIIYISHRLHELLHLGDHFTVLRSGRVVGEAPRADVSRDWIVERMSGRVNAAADRDHIKPSKSATVLSVERLSLAASSGDEAAQAPVHDVSFKVRQGEILGVYGLLGSGRTELVEALAGCRKKSAGMIRLHEKIVRIESVPDAMNAGIMLVPEDRQRDGLIPDLTIRENMTMAATRGLFLNRTKETARAKQLVKDLNIAARNLELPVTTLSGGNQQKVLLARCLMCSPSVLLLDEPTRGVDVGAKAEIYRILRHLASQGMSILFTSSEIEETRALADRVIVLCQGGIAAEFADSEVTDEALFAAASPTVGTTATPLSGMPAL